MKYVVVILVACAVIALRVGIFRSRRRRRAADDRPCPEVDGAPAAGETGTDPTPKGTRARTWHALEDALGDVGMVAGREIRERVRGRIFRVGTLVMLVAVGAAIVIPTFHRDGGGLTTQKVGVVGSLSHEAEQLVSAAGSTNQDLVTLVPERSLAAAKAGLRSGRIDLAVVDGGQILLDQPASSGSSPADPGFVQSVADYLGVLKAYQSAGLTPGQAAQVTGAKPVPVQTLQPRPKGATKTTSVIGLVLLFFMLTQYCTWILIGVMQEKSSRVVEVLLAMVRPIQLLGGKVLAATVRLASYAARGGRARDIVATLDTLVEDAAKARGWRVARVAAADTVGDDQQRDLSDALAHLTGNPVDLQVTVDPLLLGGVVVQVGDLLVDSSTRHRLDELKEHVLASEEAYRIPGTPTRRDATDG